MSVIIDNRPPRSPGDFIRKDQIPVLIQTISGMIQGYIYVRQGQRVVDALNHGDPFLAVTDAQFYDSNNVLTVGTYFITVNRAHIVWIRPDDVGVSEMTPGSTRHP